MISSGSKNILIWSLGWSWCPSNILCPVAVVTGEYVGKTSAHLAWHHDPDIRPAAYPGCQNGKWDSHEDLAMLSIHSPRIPEHVWKWKRIPPKVQARADFQTEYAPSYKHKETTKEECLPKSLTIGIGWLMKLRGWEHCLLCHMGNQIYRLSIGAKKKSLGGRSRKVRSSKLPSLYSKFRTSLSYIRASLNQK